MERLSSFFFKIEENTKKIVRDLKDKNMQIKTMQPKIL
jgi:hypothetical protein